MSLSLRIKLASICGAAVLSALGCGASGDDGGLASGGMGALGGGVCTPGEQAMCPCSDGTMATQTCLDSGAGYTACACAGGATGGATTGGATGVTTGGATGGTATGGTTGGTTTGGTTGVGNATGGTTGVSNATGGTTGGASGVTNATGGTNGVANATGGASGGTTGGSSTGGTNGGTCCPDGNCLCHGPDPTEQSATAAGPYTVDQYTSGFPTNNFLAATIYYPTDAEPPLAGVVICPGWTALQSSIAAWGPFLASHGIVTMTIDTNTTGDSVAQRAPEMMDALASLKAENTRAGSPLEGQLSADRYGLMGWSMGGGATWMNTAQHPELKTGISLAGHDATAGGAMIASGMQVPSMLFAGALDNPILGGGGQSQGVYQIIPETVPKILYEMADADHFAWGTPLQTDNGALGRYGLSFQKVFLEGDERYRQLLLVPGPGASDWRSTVQ